MGHILLVGPASQPAGSVGRVGRGLHSAAPRVPNGSSKTGLDPLVWSKVKSSPMVEIRPTGWSGLAGPGLPSNRICKAI